MTTEGPVWIDGRARPVLRRWGVFDGRARPVLGVYGVADGRARPVGVYAPGAPPPAPSPTLTRLPMQPAAIYYGNLTGPTTATFRQPGALLLTSRSNIGHANMVAASNAGAHVLAYLDAIIRVSATGDYHDLLFNASAYGANVPQWPGPVAANDQGSGTNYLSDFRPGSPMHAPATTNAAWTKLEAVLEKLVADHPHISGFFADDLGSRSWFPLLNWSTFGSQNRQDYRDGAILVLQAFRRVADRHGLFLMVNGTWGAGTLESNGGGYPVMGEHGCSLADGGVWENHGSPDAYEAAYFAQAGTQWAADSPLTEGQGFHLTIGKTGETPSVWGDTGRYAWFAQQNDYATELTSAWGPFHATGLP